MFQMSCSRSDRLGWVPLCTHTTLRQTRFQGVVLGSLWVACLTEPAVALEISRHTGCFGGDVLRLRGSIEHGDYRKFKALFANPRRIVGLDLQSDGGSLYEGVRIAAMTHRKRLATFVEKECNSACAFIFLLGAKRYIGKDAKIGVHAIGNEYGFEDNGTLRDTIHFARVSAKLGIPSSTIGKMVATPPAEITYLDQADLAGAKVHKRSPFLRKDGPGHLNCTPSADEPVIGDTTSIKTAQTLHNVESQSGNRAGLRGVIEQRPYKP